MPNYRYQVRGTSGQMQAGTISADSIATASTLLRNQGLHVMAISPIAAGLDTSGWAAKLAELNAGSPSQKHVLDFTTQLAVMIRAGINIRAALEGIADQTQHLGFKRVLVQLRTDVEGGKQFSEALARHPKLFNPLYLNMVRASEMAGSFAKMLDRIAAYMSQQQETRKMVVGAAIYPAIIGSLAVGVTIFLLTFVLPRFASVFEGKEAMIQGTAFRNSTLQGAYLMVAARMQGLDCGPMSGFDAAKVDAEFWAGTPVKTNFIVGLGYGDPAKVMGQEPRYRAGSP